ncbi:receptor-like protein Cf-9 homolog [Solanum pennellii]|uniref:Receptor-like protein Cf-9 homolog n=1 Tax=Solanum pennellii TaxID=28526 RepID=A0ABM1V272_SOLPN|nr:receptor-like protein Cf-9 homolog [Solanum pennellii]
MKRDICEPLFKQMFITDVFSKSLSWNKSIDCCSWDGVHCNEITGQVTELNLAGRGLKGKFHSNNSLFQLTNLKRLNLSFKNFSESYISPRFGELSSLTHLDLSNSRFSGLIPTEISRLSKLQVLSIQSSLLSFKPNGFELLLKNLTQLREVKFYDVNISSTIPLNFSSHLTTLFLQNTQLYGVLPERVFHLSNLETLDLSFNPQLAVRFPTSKWNSSASLMKLALSDVNAFGRIPESFGHLTSPRNLRIASCNLSGSIPKPLWNLTNIEELNLGDNYLRVIKFDGNKLEGKVMQSFINCKHLKVFDLGNNELNDTFPKWLGALPELQILNLRSNKFYGPIKDSRTYNLSAQIRVIDLSSNGFSGDLPVSLFQNFEAMKIIGEKNGTREYVADYFSDFYSNSFIVITKGLELEFPRVLTTNIIINLSSNRFEGHIPSIIGDLIGLRTLNLSHNRLEGHIPASLHQLSVLESLDLSSNKISGEIPQHLASLTSLEVLNLSHNRLVGCIPKGKQFDTFENSSYQGNDGLRGLPLSKDCGGDEGVPEATTPFELDEE